MNSTATIYARLTADPDVLAETDVFDGLPAIFDDLAPDAFQFGEDLAIVIGAPTRNEADPTLTEQSWVVVRDVRIYAKHTGSNVRLDAYANHLRRLFHLQQDGLYVEGGTVTECTVTGPVAAPTSDPSLVGRRITLRLTLEEN